MRSLIARLLKDVLGRLVILTGLHRRLLRERAVIVAFHSIIPASGGDALRCSTNDFDLYCAFFARHLSPSTLTELAGLVRSGKRLEGRVAITFDDGYRDNAELAAPVLSRHRLKATFFVTTGFIGSGHQAPWDVEAGRTSRWMSSDHVVALHNSGHEIGAHTHNHVDLGTTSEAGGVAEIARSAEAIRLWTGVAPRHFAVPFGRAFPTLGRISQRVREELGFETVTMCRGGVLDPASQSVAWERFPIDPKAYFSPYGWLIDVLRDRDRKFDYPDPGN